MTDKYDEKSSKLDFAKESANLLLRQTLLFNPNHHFSVVLHDSSGSADFIKSMDIADLDTFHILNSIHPTESYENRLDNCCKNILNISI